MTRNTQIALAAVAAVAALAAYWMLALAPKREEASKLNRQIVSAQQELTTAEGQLASYQAAKATFKDNYATVARLGKAVPEEDDVRSLVVQLDAAAKRSKVDFRTISLSPAPAAAGEGAAAVGTAGFLTTPFEFTFKGRFFRLGDFFSRLEQFVDVSNKRIDVTGRLLQLTSIELKPDGEGFPKISAQIGATSYRLPVDQGLTAGATSQGPGAGAKSTAPKAASAAAGATSTSAIVTGAK